MAKNAAPELAATTPYTMPHTIQPSEEMLEALDVGPAALRKADYVIDRELRSGFTEDEVRDHRIARFIVNVEEHNPELLRTASAVPKVTGPEGLSLERVKVFQSLENAGWIPKLISKPDV